MKLKKQKGNIADIMSTGICILAMSALLLFYLQSMGTIQQKQEVSQLARKYILKMETVGCLTAADKIRLDRELTDIGIGQIRLDGTTVNKVGYGEPITLCIHGTLKGGFLFEEKKVSTAKN